MNLKFSVCGAIAAATFGTSALAAAPGEANLATFKPATASDGIVATEGASPWQSTAPFELKLWFDYAEDPVRRPGGGAVVENAFRGWAVANLHLLEPLTLGIAVPFTLHEHGSFVPALGPRQTISTESGVGDIRITPRIGLARQENAGVDLALETSIDLPSSEENLLTGWGEPTAEVLLAIARSGPSRAHGLKYIANLFAFTAPNRTVAGTDLGAGFGGRLGAQYATGVHGVTPTRVFAEIEARSMPRRDPTDGPTPAEWRGGLSWCFGPGFTFDLAAGTGFNESPGSPSYRIIGGLGLSANACGAAGSATKNLAADRKAAEDKAAADKAAADKAAADKSAANKAAADKAAADKAAADKAAADKAAADRAAADKAAADRAAADKAAAAAAAAKAAEERAAAEAAAKKDSDGDGVPDIEDNCPNEKGPASNHGCPPSRKQRVAVTREGIQVLDKVQFAAGKAVISPASHKLLDQVAAVLKAHPDLTSVEVQGYTDNSGDAEKNRTLSQARADAVVAYLVKKGVEASRLTAKGYGPDQPVADNASKQGREQNRRVEFKVVR